MDYKVAVATSDGINIDMHFGQTNFFTIYQVNEDKTYSVIEKRRVVLKPKACKPVQSGCGGCGDKKRSERVALISDCNCVLCAGCGTGSVTKLGKQGITAFIVEKTIDEAIIKIIKYYAKENIVRRAYD